MANAADKPTTIYTGTLGAQPIVMELTPVKGNLSVGRYFYVRHRHDLLLTAQKVEAGHVEALEGRDFINYTDDKNPTPLITLDQQPNGGWRGTWQHDSQSKALPIMLEPAKPAQPAADNSPYLQHLYASDPFEYLRLAGLKLQDGKRESFMGHTLQWRSVPDAKIAFFEIMDGYPEAERKRINRVLMDRLWKEVGASYGCMGNGGYDQTVTPHLLTPNLISISVFTSYDCGGAHPDFGDSPINLNAHTAKSLSLEDILWVGKSKPQHYMADIDPNATDFDAYSTYREQEFAPWLVAQLKHLYPTDMHEGDCDYSDPSVWQFVSWHMTPKGIFLSPVFARAMRVCEANDDWSLLPWSVVRKRPGKLRLTP